jgi:hypothetical protein
MVKLPLPIRGINKGITVSVTPSEYTTNMDNVRPRDVLEQRVRLGQRPGLKKWSTDQVGGSEQPVVAMCSVSSVS